MNDELIKSALKESMIQEYAAFLDTEEHEFSSNFEKKMSRMFRKRKSTWSFGSAGGKRLGIGAICLMLLLTGAFFLMTEAGKEFSLTFKNHLEEMLGVPLNQRHAVKANNRIMNSFETDENGVQIYPDDFAGTYIDGEQLILCLKKGTGPAVVNKYLDITGAEAKYVSIKEVDYSQNELQIIADLLAEELSGQGVTIYSYGVDVPNNGISFTTMKDNAEQIKNLSQKACSNIICSVEVKESPSLMTDYYFGETQQSVPNHD